MQSRVKYYSFLYPLSSRYKFFTFSSEINHLLGWHFSMIKLWIKFDGGNGMRKFLALLLAVTLLTGCSDTMKDIKDAAAGINSKATEAATAISIDVHSIRAIELAFDNKQVTINDLFKTILRDVQWHYDESANILKISGTWKNNQLFSEQYFTEQQKQQLIENGKVTIQLHFVDNQLLESKTAAQLTLHNELLVDLQGEQLLQHFYDVFKN